MSDLMAYVKTVLPTHPMWLVVLATIAIATLSISLPGYLHETWPELKIPEQLLFQAAFVSTILFFGSFVLLVLSLRHIHQLKIKSEVVIPKNLDNDMENLLLLVSNNERMSNVQIASIAGLSKQVATLNLHELRDAKLVSSHFGLDENSREVDTWLIEQPGRKYLSHHGFL